MMQTLDFRRWLESELDDPIAIKDPKAMAQHWMANMPEEPAKQNKENITLFAKYMAEPFANGQAVADHLAGLEVNELRYPDKPIGNNLLNENDERLGDARGFITNQEEAEFKFFMGGTRQGSLLIQHPPVVYTDEDEKLMESIIWHESGHAVDWLDPKFKYVPPSGRFRWNPEAYAANIHEARRYADQLRFLMRKVGDVNKVMQMLEGPSKFRMAAALIPTAKAFLKEYELKTENWARTLAAPLLAASSLMGGQEPTMPPTTAGIVVNQQNEFAQAAATTVARIIQMLKLSNFVTKG